MIDLCWRLQIDLARLKILRHLAGGDGDQDTMTAGIAQVGAMLSRLQHVLADRAWIFPEQMTGLASELDGFPAAELTARAGQAELADSLAADLPEVIAILRAGGASVERQRVSKRLLPFVNALRDATQHGAPFNSVAVERLVEPLTIDQDKVRTELLRWARRQDRPRGMPMSALLAHLVAECPAVHPLAPMMADLWARTENLLYVPVVFVQQREGLVLPVRVDVDFATEAPPEFSDIETGASFDGRIDPEFQGAIGAARLRAMEVFATLGRLPSVRKFKVVVHVPRLRIGRMDVAYEHGSFTMPVTLAIVTQHPKVRPYLTLQPEVLTTGPTSLEALRIKAGAMITVGGASKLLAEINRSEPPGDLPARVRVVHDRGDVLVREYFPQAQLASLQDVGGNVIELATQGYRWNAPILLRQRLKADGRNFPYIQPRHEHQLAELVREHRVSQLEGLSGIGKTWLVAQWLRQAQENFDLVVHMAAPAQTTPPAMHAWARAQFEGLADVLSGSWDLPEPARRLASLPELDGGPESLDVFMDALEGKRVLWVIDDAQELFDAQFEIGESLLQQLVAAPGDRPRLDWRILLVTNRRLRNDVEVPSLHLTKGFTLDESRDFLQQSGWLHPDVRERVAKALHGHPRALSLLVPFVRHYHVHEDEIAEWVENLETVEGERDLVRAVCNRILSKVFERLRAEAPQSWQALRVASTFSEGFSRRDFQTVSRKLAWPTAAPAPADLELLDQVNLVNWTATRAERYWSMHSLVREYVQDEFASQLPKLFRSAHRNVGLLYFPLTAKGGQLAEPDGRYADKDGCATALRHFDLAGYDAGQVAVLNNWNEHQVPRAKWWMTYGFRHQNQEGYARAEALLRQTMTVYGSGEGEQAGKSLAPENIVALLGRALAGQALPAKRREAVECYQLVLGKGYHRVTSQLASVLCDLSSDKDCDEWQQARRLFDEVSTAITTGSSAYFLDIGEMHEKVARRYAEYGDGETAIRVIEQLYSTRANKWPPAYVFAIRFHEQAGNVDAAILWAERGLSLVPRDRRIWREYVWLCARTGRMQQIPVHLRRTQRGAASADVLINELIQQRYIDQALLLLDDAVDVYGRHDLWSIARAQCLQLQGKPPAMVAAEYRAAINLNPANERVYLKFARFLTEIGEHDTAGAVLEQGVSQVKTGMLFAALGAWHQGCGRPDDAANVFRKAIEVLPDHESGYLGLAQALGEDETASAILQQGANRAKTEALFSALGEWHERRQRLDDAEKVYRQAIELLPHNEFGYSGLARVLEIRTPLGEPTTADQDAVDAILKQGLKLAPNAVLVSALGRRHERRQRLDEAESVYRKGVELLPDHPCGYLGLARLLEQREHGSEVEALLKKASARQTASVDLFVALGDWYARRGRYAEAEENFKKALIAAPHAHFGYAGLAKLFNVLGRSSEAEAVLREGCERTVSAPLYADLGEFYVEAQRPEEAKKIYRSGIERCAATAGLLYRQLASLEKHTGNLEAAEAVAVASIKMRPQRGGLRAFLAGLYLETGRIDEAGKIVAEGLAFSESGELKRMWARVLEAQGAFQQAEDFYRSESLKAPPDRNPFWSRLHDLLKRNKHDAEAEALANQMKDVPWSTDPGYADAISFFRAEGNQLVAEDTCRRWVAFSPDADRPYLTLASVLEDQGRIEDARAVLAQARTRAWQSTAVIKAIKAMGISKPVEQRAHS